MALYQFYNADLIEIPKEEEGKSAGVYINDAIIATTADSFKEAHEKLKNMMTRKGGAMDWAKKTPPLSIIS